MNDLLLTLFSKYSELLKQRFSEDFTEIVSTDDYMPMTLNSIEEYDKVVTVSWYTPEKEREELTYVALLLRYCISRTNYDTVSLAFYPSHRCIHYAASMLETSSIRSTSFPMITFKSRPSSTKRFAR